MKISISLICFIEVFSSQFDMIGCLIICSSILILWFPVVVRKFFLIVSRVELSNHSWNVCITNCAVTSRLMLYWKAMFQAKFFSEIWVTVVRRLIWMFTLRACRLVTKYRTHSQIWKISSSLKSNCLNVFRAYCNTACSFSSSSLFFCCRYCRSSCWYS